MNRALLWSWILVVIVVVVPWTTFQNHTHWSNVTWIPFSRMPMKWGDAIRNVLLYVPFGYLASRQKGRIQLWRIAAYALALSVATEFTQVFSHGRFPSATDVTCNVAGAVLGAVSWAPLRE